jgi:uncharacterized protein YlaI
MSYQCTVCEQVKRRSALQFLEPIDDWICDDCLEKGSKHGVSDLEDGKELTRKIREGDL